MRKTLLLLIATLCLSSVFAQQKTKDVEIRLGDPVKTGNRSLFFDALPVDNNEYLVFMNAAKGFIGFHWEHTVARLNSRMNYGNEKQIQLMQGSDEIELFKLVKSGTNYYAFTFKKLRKEKRTIVYYHTITPGNLSVSKGRQIGVFNWDGYKRSNSGDFDIILSPDNSKIMLLYLLPYEKDKPEMFQATVYDTGMEVVWERKYKLPYKDGNFSIEEVLVGNDGELTLIGRKWSTKERRSDPSNFTYVLMHSPGQGESLEENEIILRNQYIATLKACLDKDKNIICTGFYSDKSRGTSIKGAYYVKISAKTRSIDVQTTKEFGMDIIKEGMTRTEEKKASKRAQKGKDVEMPEYSFRDLVIRSDGSIILAAEQWYIVVHTTTSQNGATRTTYYYHYRDILTTCFDADGSILWINKIPKYQYTANDNGAYSSYAMMVSDDKVFYIFNETEKNHIGHKGTNNRRMGLKKPVVCITSIDNNGKHRRETLLGKDQNKIAMMPRNWRAVNNKELVMYGKRGSKAIFGSIKIKE